jgi:broad specificity phosphatase PhoE
MATMLFLMRHVSHPLVGRVLCGRMPGVHLDAQGRMESARLARRLAGERLAAVYSSPMARAVETARPIAERQGIEPRLSEAITEIDFGAWAGRGFDALDPDPQWQHWNAHRSEARAPGGESMQEVRARTRRFVAELCEAHPEAAVAAVSHGDVVKAILADCLGLSIDAHARFEISPGALSFLVYWNGGGKVLRMNEAVAA